jgi:putative membrane protein
MKKSYTKKIFGMLAITGLLVCAASCNNNKANEDKTEDTKQQAEEHNDAKFENKQEKDAQFLVDAADISMTEIELGKLAESHGTMPEVRELGKTMIADHTKALNEVKSLASKKQITLPTEMSNKSMDAYKMLDTKTGKDFDKDYCDKMVDGHKDAISKFEKAAADSKDEEIKNWASSTLPTLRKHLDSSMACQEKCKNNKS